MPLKAAALFAFLLAAGACGTAARAASSDEPLRFRREGDWLKFKVLVFSDLHYGESAANDRSSDAFQERMLRLEAPVDLVLFNGDMSSDYAAPRYCRNAENRRIHWVRASCMAWWTARWKEYTASVVTHKVPYALNLGNHDVLAALDENGREQLAHDIVTNAPLSRTQVSWFQTAARRTGEVPSHMFVHIPVEEALHLWNRHLLHGEDIEGSALEDIDCSALNTGLFAASSDPALGVQGVWHGHDHNNDFFGAWAAPGPFVGYSRKSGYGGYQGAIAAKPGSRVIEFSAPLGPGRRRRGTGGAGGAGKQEDGGRSGVEWSTWIRLESGEYATAIKPEARQLSRRKLSDFQVLCGNNFPPAPAP